MSDTKAWSLQIMAKILEARAARGKRVTVSREMARELARVCRELAWQEGEVVA